MYIKRESMAYLFCFYIQLSAVEYVISTYISGLDNCYMSALRICGGAKKLNIS